MHLNTWHPTHSRLPPPRNLDKENSCAAPSEPSSWFRQYFPRHRSIKQERTNMICWSYSRRQANAVSRSWRWVASSLRSWQFLDHPERADSISGFCNPRQLTSLAALFRRSSGWKWYPAIPLVWNLVEPSHTLRGPRLQATAHPPARETNNIM